NHLRVDRALRLEAEVGVARLAAGAARELGQARGQADAAAVEDAVGVDRGQRARIAVVGRTRRSGYEAEAVAGRGRAGKFERPAVAADRRARGPRIRPVAVDGVLRGIDELDVRPGKAGERGGIGDARRAGGGAAEVARVSTRLQGTRCGDAQRIVEHHVEATGSA